MAYIIFGLFLIVLGILDLILSILNKNKLTKYNRKDKITIINREGFFKLQFYFSIVESIYLIVFGILNTLYKVRISYFVIGALLFFYITSQLKVVSKKKGYANYT